VGCRDARLKLLEPLRELFKDEVRELGVALGLPHDMVYRHRSWAWPGCSHPRRGKEGLCRPAARADAIFIEELRNMRDVDTGKTWYELTSQAFAVFLPVKSVGVMGDGALRLRGGLRAVQTSDFMTADWAELPYSLLKKVSGGSSTRCGGINRVTYDVSSKPPAPLSGSDDMGDMSEQLSFDDFAAPQALTDRYFFALYPPPGVASDVARIGQDNVIAKAFSASRWRRSALT